MVRRMPHRIFAGVSLSTCLCALSAILIMGQIGMPGEGTRRALTVPKEMLAHCLAGTMRV